MEKVLYVGICEDEYLILYAKRTYNYAEIVESDIYVKQFAQIRLQQLALERSSLANQIIVPTWLPYKYIEEGVVGSVDRILSYCWSWMRELK
jgi:glutaredoxin-related protein